MKRITSNILKINLWLHPKWVILLLKFLLLFFLGFQMMGQSNDSISQTLDTISLSIAHQRDNFTAPMVIHVLGENDIQAGSGALFLLKINSIPGIRWEERSPGSFRLSMRGSAVRSPFGVRNVRVYFDDVPLTAPSGITYLTNIGTSTIDRIEIIKGGSSSLYGSGYGGAVHMYSTPFKLEKTTAEFAIGSFGLQRYHFNFVNDDTHIGVESIKNNGYRDHSALHKNSVIFKQKFEITQKQTLDFEAILSQLFYQTPGGLTKEEFEVNPTSSRPSTAVAFSAQQANASINQSILVLNGRYKYWLQNSLLWKTNIYYVGVSITNPSIQNYEIRKEPYIGGRSALYKSWVKSGIDLVIGLEYQKGWQESQVYVNLFGQKGMLTRNEKNNTFQLLPFVQSNWSLGPWNLSAGISMQNTNIQHIDIHPFQSIRDFKTFSGLQPRIGISYGENDKLTYFIQASKGFSSPQSADIFSDSDSRNLDLKSEKAQLLEIGVKGRIGRNILSYELVTFYQNIKDLVVTRRTELGGNYFINAGSVDQLGIESKLVYDNNNSSEFLPKVQMAYTFQQFTYEDFIINTTNHSGNKLPGIPKHSFSLDCSWLVANKWNFSANGYLYGSTFLDDSNSNTYPSFGLLNAYISYTKDISVLSSSFPYFGSVIYRIGLENISNTSYSLGNDTNAFNGRYYNAGQGRTLFASIIIKPFLYKKFR